VTRLRSIDPDDTPALRKERGAFFTPDEITRFVANWAIRKPDDLVLEPSAGDAAFLIAAVRRLRKLSAGADLQPTVNGVEIHAHSARIASQRGRLVEKPQSGIVTFSRSSPNRSTTLLLAILPTSVTRIFQANLVFDPAKLLSEAAFR